MQAKDIPNIISVLRVILVFPIVYYILSIQFGIAMLLFAIAGLSDALDGFLAKHYHWQSRLGSILDPLADKLLLVASIASLCWHNLLPMWLFLLVLGRDIFIVSGGIIYHYLYGQFELLPVWSSKINTLLQILLVLAVIAGHYANLIDQAALDIAIFLVVLSVVVSGMEYIIVWGKRAWQQQRKNSDA